MMKSLLIVIWRLMKVIYVLLILVGLILGAKVWNTNQPYKTYTYEVICDNGKIFDPTSKPIDVTPRFVGRIYGNRTRLSFDEDQMKSECEYGTAWAVGLSSQLTKNYQLKTIETEHNTLNERIKYTAIVLVAYYLILEVARRIFLYVLFGKNVLTLKK